MTHATTVSARNCRLVSKAHQNTFTHFRKSINSFVHLSHRPNKTQNGIAYVVVVVDLHHGRVDARSQTLDLDEREHVV